MISQIGTQEKENAKKRRQKHRREHDINSAAPRGKDKRLPTLKSVTVLLKS